MNRRARELGLRDTRFGNPIGLDEEGAGSSARDLARLALEVRRDAFLRRTVDLPRATLRSGRRRRALVNRNGLVREVPWVDGVKTGRTQAAGYVLVGSATRRGVTVVSAVLGADSEAARDADTRALLRFGLRAFRPQVALREGDRLASVPLAARDERVALLATRGVRRIVPRDRPLEVRVGRVPAELDGPLPRGARVAVAEVVQGRRVLARVPLVTAAPVDEAGVLLRVRDALGGSLPLVVAAAALLAASLPLVALRRRARRRRRRTRRERRLA
jgi:D-alanyl-D-alanine carboxypeptidase (penicillin-binding protein 5/6)